MPEFIAILKRSLSTARRFKWLWIYGALLGTASAGSSNYSFNPSDFQNENIPENSKEVLGAFTNSFTDWLGSVLASSWVVLALAILIAITFALTIKMVLTSWAQASLIHGLYTAHLGGSEVTLKSTSKKGIKRFYEMIKLSVLLFLVLALTLIVPILIISIFIIGGNSGDVLAYSGLWILLIILFAPVYLAILISSIYAQRLIVINELNYKDALKAGWRLFMQNKLATLVLGVINSLASSAIGFLGGLTAALILGIPAFLTLYPAIKSGEFPSVAAIVFTGLLFIIFIFLMSIMAGFVNVFKYSNWNQLFYWAIDKKEEK